MSTEKLSYEYKLYIFKRFLNKRKNPLDKFSKNELINFFFRYADINDNIANKFIKSLEKDGIIVCDGEFLQIDKNSYLKIFKTVGGSAASSNPLPYSKIIEENYDDFYHDCFGLLMTMHTYEYQLRKILGNLAINEAQNLDTIRIFEKDSNELRETMKRLLKTVKKEIAPVEKV